MSLFRCGGGTDNTPVHPSLIGQYTINSTSAVTRTLTESIAGYKYLWFSMEPITSDTVWLGTTTGAYGRAFVDVDYFRNNQLTLLYTQGSSGSATNQTVLLNYVDDTTFTSKASASATRYIYVYGIKDMPRGLENTVAEGIFTASTTESTNVVLGFRPRYICIEYVASSTVISTLVYNEAAISNKQIISSRNGSTGACSIEDIPYTGTSGGRITSLNSDGFTLGKISSTYGTTAHYFAIA